VRPGTRVAPGARRAGEARAGGADGLTERERDVAELVARGRTNREVAAALFLSEKTVENHLSRVYAKLGLRSRAELVAALGAQP
jgi:DNA-binding CsgD family transcriptional regulator